jgi:nucleoside-diphosphate-sugar epimerase
MKNNSVLFVGCGDLGIRTGMALHAEAWRVHGVRRNPEVLPDAFTAHQADYTLPGDLDFVRDLSPELVVASFNPAGRTEEGYRLGFLAAARNLLSALGDYRPCRVLFVSSTRVQAGSGGALVDEGSPLATEDPWARAIIEAEQTLLQSPHAVTVVRFAGIYGMPGGRLLSRIRRGELCEPAPGRWSNRIHREDSAGFLAHLLRDAAAGNAIEPVYIGVDDKPELQYEVETWLAREMGLEIEKQQAEEQSASGKRCVNRLLHASGYRLRYPDYKSGYRAVLESAD